MGPIKLRKGSVRQVFREYISREIKNLSENESKILIDV